MPSVSSSFFFSESPSSGNHSLHDDLIIPSLSLPPPLNQPTPFGQTLGLLRLLILGPQGAGKSFLTGLLLEDNEDVVQVGPWEDCEDAKVLKASTDWVELNDSERYEPTRNVHIVELPGYSEDADVGGTRSYPSTMFDYHLVYRTRKPLEIYYSRPLPSSPCSPPSRYRPVCYDVQSSRLIIIPALHCFGLPSTLQ